MSLKNGIVNSLNGVLPPDYRELIRVVERKGLTDWTRRTSTRGASPPVLPQRKGTQGLTNYSRTTIRYELRSVKTVWQCRPATE